MRVAAGFSIFLRHPNTAFVVSRSVTALAVSRDWHFARLRHPDKVQCWSNQWGHDMIAVQEIVVPVASTFQPGRRIVNRGRPAAAKSGR